MTPPTNTRKQSTFLPGDQERARWMRMDTGAILKRFFFCERELVIAQAGWLPGIASFEVKAELPRFLWQSALTADALRSRVFELRYPNRLMEVGEDGSLVEVFTAARRAPHAEAFIAALARVYVPFLRDCYRLYLDRADKLTDGPLLPALRTAVAQKNAQIERLRELARAMLADRPDRKSEVNAWTRRVRKAFDAVGGCTLDSPEPVEVSAVLGSRSFRPAEEPARDASFRQVRFYWPDVVVEGYPYGEGLRLQLRSAISHLNEIWAVDAAGFALYALSDALGWEFIPEMARWTYDEARHMQMGFERLRSWGFERSEIPVGTYIYDSTRGEPAVIRLAMLHYFETKNIGKKTTRRDAFAEFDDQVSQHDMDFSWADEAIHAHYGQRWLNALHDKSDRDVPSADRLKERCARLVEKTIASATEEERREILEIADAMMEKAERLATADSSS